MQGESKDMRSLEPGLTREVAAIVHDTTSAALGADGIERVKQVVADGIAVALAGCGEPPIAIAAAHARFLGGTPQAGVWGWGYRTSVVQAASINAMATHVLDFDPMWSPPTHAVSPTVPVAFALAQRQPATGLHLLTAVAKGLEIQNRLQLAADQYTPEALRFHPPGVSGVLGSAVVAATLLDLDAERLRHALGIAASRAGALLANVGSMTKCTHCGHAAASGLEAALLAMGGYTANPDVLEAPKGFVETYYPERFDAAKLLAYGRPFRVVDPGAAIKRYPSQYGTHFAIAAALELQAKIGDASRIARVHVRSPLMKYIDRPQPASGLDGKFSLQYATAAALLVVAVTIDSFTDARRFRDDMAALLARITLEQDPALAGDFHHMRVQVDVELVSGERLSAECRKPRGAWGAPLTREEHRTKLEDCTSRALGEAPARALLDALERLESQDTAGVAKIIALIGEASAPGRDSPRAR
jgi:aconitate decarboxylase